jgi:Fe-S oxidoreductase
MENQDNSKGASGTSTLPIVQFNTKCTTCGLCKPSCPTYNVLFDEAVSPRGKVVLMKNNILSNHLYLCTLCKACETFCTVPGIDVVDNIRKAREEMVKAGKETEAGRRMINNIRTHGFAVVSREMSRNTEIFGC